MLKNIQDFFNYKFIMLEKMIVIVIATISLFIVYQKKLIIIIILSYAANIAFTISEMRTLRTKTDESIKKMKNIKLLKQLILISLYTLCVFLILEQSIIQHDNHKRKQMSIIRILFGKIPTQKFIYLIPLILSSCWKSYYIFEQREKIVQNQPYVEQLIGLQCQSQMYILVYFVIQKMICCFHWTIFTQHKFKSTILMADIAILILMTSYLGIKYEWSRGLRNQCWKTHLFCDKIATYLGIRQVYHKVHVIILAIHALLKKIQFIKKKKSPRISKTFKKNLIKFGCLEQIQYQPVIFEVRLEEYFDFL